MPGCSSRQTCIFALVDIDVQQLLQARNSICCHIVEAFLILGQEHSFCSLFYSSPKDTRHVEISLVELILFQIIVDKAEWLGSPANIKGANRDAKIQFKRLLTAQNRLFCSDTLCMNYVTNTFLLVMSSELSKQLLCFVHGQDQKNKQKHTTKNFVEFHSHSPPLTTSR